MLQSVTLHTHLWMLVRVFSDSHHVESLASYPQPRSFKYRSLGSRLAPQTAILWGQVPRRCIYSKAPGGSDLQPKLKFSRIARMPRPAVRCIAVQPVEEREGLWGHDPSTPAVISRYIWGHLIETTRQSVAGVPVIPVTIRQEGAGALSALIGNLGVLWAFPLHWVLNHFLNVVPTK